MVQFGWLNSLHRSRRPQRLRPLHRKGQTLWDRIEACEPRCVLSAAMLTGPESPPSDAAYFTSNELTQHLQEVAWMRWEHLFGQTIPQYDGGWWSRGDVIALDDLSISMTANAIGGAEASRVLSDTNTQVVGVDEADFLENDGHYLYLAHGSRLTIFNAVPAGELSVVAQVDLNGDVVGEFLDGDRLTVITQSSAWLDDSFGGIAFARPMWDAGWNWNPQTTVTVFDVSDRSSPLVTEQTVLDGSVLEARAVGSSIYLVLQNDLKLPEPEFVETPVEDGEGSSDDETSFDDMTVFDGSGDESDMRLAVLPSFWEGWTPPKIIANRTYESFDDYVARVGDQLAELSLPRVFGVGAEGALEDLGSLGGGSIRRPDDEFVTTLLTVATFNSHDGQAGINDAASIFSSYASAVYMTADALIVATPEYRFDEFGSQSRTRLDRFTIQGTDVEWQADGQVQGLLLDQFSLDEHDGFLRVATHVSGVDHITTFDGGEQWVWRSDNSVTVLDTAGGTLDLVAQIEGIAPGEQLFAARFLGDQGYLVTFLQIDPLFTLDLSDPTQPTVVGELEIPGFSNYLQSAGDGRLFGIGQERTPGTWQTRLHVSLLDVSDAASPTQLDREYLGGDAQWVSSEAQYDHHALSYFSDGLLVIPVVSESWNVSEESWNWDWQETLVLLQVQTDGIDVVGQITANQPIVRSARIDNVLYLITEHSVTAFDLRNLSELSSVEYASGDASDSTSPDDVIYLSTTAGGEIVQRGETSESDNPGAMDGLPTTNRSNFANAAGLFDRGSPLMAFGAPLNPGSFSAVTVSTSLPPWMLAGNAGATTERWGHIANTTFVAFELPSSNEADGEGSDLGDSQSVEQFWQQAGERLRDEKSPMGPTDETAPAGQSPAGTNKPQSASNEQTPRRSARRTNPPSRPTNQSSQNTTPKSAAITPGNSATRKTMREVQPVKLVRPSK